MPNTHNRAVYYTTNISSKLTSSSPCKNSNSHYFSVRLLILLAKITEQSDEINHLMKNGGNIRLKNIVSQYQTK